MKLSFLLATCIAIISLGQGANAQSDKVVLPKDSTGQICYVEVVKLDNVSATDLYSRAKIFVADSYKSAKDVVQLSDDASKTIIVKPTFIPHIKDIFGFQNNYGSVTYQLRIECKDNRYRFTINDFWHHGETIRGQTAAYEGGDVSQVEAKWIRNVIWRKIQEDTAMEIKLLKELVKQSMAKTTSDF